MRPLKLTMQGFGSFCQKTLIDFSKLGDSGVYLISGDTGSGKTTIFDAICFALYGRASGKYRDGKTFRSDYASPKIPTIVELEFMQRGERYKVIRNPEYPRLKTRGQGTTMESPSVTFIMPDGREESSGSSGSGSISKIDQRIIEEVGFDYQQFVQAVMLPQNSFTELVNAKTDERLEILKKIYDTKLYSDFQAKLKEKVQDLKKNFEGIDDEIANIRTERRLGTGDPLEELQGMISRLEDQAASLADRRKLKEDRLGQARKDLEAEGQRLDLVKGISQLEEKIDQTKSQVDAANKEKEALGSKNSYIDGLKAKRSAMDQSMEDYTSIDRNRQAFEELEQAKLKLIQARDINKDNINDLRASIGGLEKQLEGRESLLEEISLKKRDFGEAVSARQEAKKLSDDYCKLVEKKCDLIDLKQAHQDAADDYKDKQASYNQTLDMFEASQSYLIAQNLKEGQACPVCGSTSHPKLAEKTHETVDKDCLDKAANDLEEARKIREAAFEKLSFLEGQFKEGVKTLLASKLLKDSKIDDFKDSGDVISQIYQRAEEEEKLISGDLKQLEYKEAKNKEASKKKKDQAELLETARSELEAILPQITDAEKTLSSLQSKIETLSQKLEYDSKDKAQEAFNKIDLEIKEYERSLTDLEDKREKLSSSLSSWKGQLTSDQDKLSKYKPIDVEETRQREANLSQEIEEIDSSLKENSGALALNRSALEKIKRLLKKKEDIDQRFGPLKDLSDTMNGSLKGQVKLSLETYIQRMYFKRVVERANERLVKLSDEKFELVLKDTPDSKRGQTGLDLNVNDSYTGQERSLASLSGGEGFQVALSLALGLSDQVQASMGGVDIDVLFIDEGFGSLSGDHLHYAMSMLNQLAAGNVLVGIISHVEEVKSSIDKQILVSNREGLGSTAKIVV